MSEQVTTPLDALEDAIKARNLDLIEEAWIDLAAGGTQHLSTLINQTDAIAKAISPAQASLLLQMLAPDLIAAGNVKEAFDTLQAAASHTPTDRDVRGQIIECARQLHEGSPMLERAIELSKITEYVDLRRALGIFNAVVAIQVGNYVYHESGWGVGEIVEVDEEEEALFIDFKERSNHRMLFAAMGQMLQSIDSEHYLVKLTFDPDDLKAMGKNDPAGLVKKVLQDEGRTLKARQVKSKLVGPVFSTAGWTKFWTAAKIQLRRDPAVDLGPGNNPDIKLLKTDVATYEDSMVRKLRDARTVIKKVGMVRDYLDHRGDGDASAFLVPALSELMPRLISDIANKERFVLIMMYQDMLKELPPQNDMQIPTPVLFLQGVEDVSELLEEAEIDDYRKGAMPVIQEAQPETWQDTYRDILVSKSSILWDAAYRGLASQKDHARIDSAFKEVYREREEKPENFAWFCRSGVLGRIPTEVLNHSRVDFLEYMFIQLDKLGSERGTQNLGTEARLLAGKVRQIILTELGDNVKKLFEEAGINRTRQILGLVSHNRGLTEAQRFTVETLAYTVFPKLDVAEEKKPHEDEDSIWVTENGLSKRRGELHDLLQVELPQVARDIGKAKEFGDLSENAEYTASLEKQAQLAGRAEAMEVELKKAKIIDSGVIADSQVSIGTRVTLRNAERRFMETYTILGPWDADSEQNIVSYRAALAQGLIGCKQGEERTIDLPDGRITYQVMAIVEAV